MEKQLILSNENNYAQLEELLVERSYHRIFLVCGKSFGKLPISEFFTSLEKKHPIEVIVFDEIRPNPLYETIAKGVRLYKDNKCDCIIAVGGGSPMDSAKCIKMFMNMDDEIDYLDQEIIVNDIPFIAIPTTAGTGSEATRFAIIYHHGEKVTVSHESCIPEVVLFDPDSLLTLSTYQKKATMMDALSHAVESSWSVKANDQSKSYAYEAIRMIIANKDGYLANTPEGNSNMLKAAYLAGKAINITQSTAGHAMCYKLTSIYGLSHGHAVAAVMSKLYPYVLEHLDDHNDPRGRDYLAKTLDEIAQAMGTDSREKGCECYVKLVEELGLNVPETENVDYDLLINAVNPDRLSNNPVRLDKDAIACLYEEIFNKLEK